MRRHFVNRLNAAVAVLLAVLLAACGEGGEAEPTATTATTTAPTTTDAGVEALDAPGLLREALTNMNALAQYYAEADLVIGADAAAIDGHFGTDAGEFTLTQVDGTQLLIRVDGSAAAVSVDGGATWEEDAAGSFLGLYRVVTGSLASNLLDQGEVELVGDEEVNGEPATHLRVAAESPVDVWIGDDPRAGKVVRQIRAVAEASDIGDFDLAVVFSDFVPPG